MATNEELRNAYIKFVMGDDEAMLIACCFKYGISYPNNRDEFATGVYIAVQDEEDIPEDVKKTARAKLAEVLKRKGIISWL